MSLTAGALFAAERFAWPDWVTRSGIDWLVEQTGRRLDGAEASAGARFAQEMDQYPISVQTDAANSQHYELPAEFFDLVLGPQRKYSCCLYADDASTLADAEELALDETAKHAGLTDGQHILELGCGWGSLSLWMARHYPNARITAVSNSHSQRAHILAAATREGLANLHVITADMNDFAPSQKYDRIVSVEMFEHMSNWRALLQRISGWLNPEGRLFVHVFTHRATPYRFDASDKNDWIAQNFFTGGIMPSRDLIRHFSDCFQVEAEWRWNGVHYQRTAQDWLANFDRRTDSIDSVLRFVYGRTAPLAQRRWRLFFLATAQLFGNGAGNNWGVSHYRLKATGARSSG